MLTFRHTKSAVKTLLKVPGGVARRMRVDRCGARRQMLSMIEHDKAKPLSHLPAKLASALDGSMDDLHR